MSLESVLPPSGFAWRAAGWLFVVVGWAAATVWIDRDARQRFGRSQPWLQLLVGLGCCLAWGSAMWGIWAGEAIGWLMAMFVASYAAMRTAMSREWQQGPLAAAMQVLKDAAHVIGMHPDDVGRRPLVNVGGAGRTIVLLKKDGSVYGGREVKRLDKTSSRAVACVKEVIGDAIACGATDIHMEPRSTEVNFRFRVDGLLQQDRAIDPNEGKAVVSTIKVLSDMDIAERRLPQDGTFSVVRGSERYELRVNSTPGKFGEKLAIRLLDPGGRVLKDGLGGLGFRDTTLTKIRELVHRPYGMVVVCGPTGSGKTTTSCAAISEMDGLTRNIITIEDPIEYQLDNVTQIAVNTAAGLTFASILRSVLRQDPDVILVGEIRDQETAEIAMQAALTGHLVITTLHANDAPTTIARLIEIGIDATLMQSALTAVVAQRLLRALCSDCKVKYKPSPEELNRYGLPANKVQRLYRANPQGCSECGGRGYRGRSGVYELMVMDAELRQLLVGRPSEAMIREVAKRQGMKTLYREALYKAVAGITSLEEVDRSVGGGGAG